MAALPLRVNGRSADGWFGKDAYAGFIASKKPVLSWGCGGADVMSSRGMSSSFMVVKSVSSAVSLAAGGTPRLESLE